MLGYIKNILFSAKYWVYSGLVVFVLGTGTVIITRILLHINHPRYFEKTIPSISKSAAFPPGNYFFSISMTIVCINIFVLCYMIYQLNRHRIRTSGLDAKKMFFCVLMNNAALVSFIFAATSLLSLSIVSLETDSDFHIDFSRYFFISITLAFIFDTLCVSRLWASGIKISSVNTYFYLRYALCFLTIVDAVFFQFMFTVKDAGFFDDRYFAQQLYITSEHMLAFMAFAYAGAYFPEIFIHYRKNHELAGSGPG